MVEGGADLLLIETSQDILEVKAAVWGINQYFEEAGVRIPIQAQVTLDTSGRMLFGTDIASALTTLEALPIDVMGINCSTGPEYMREPIKYLVEHSPLPDQRAAQRRAADQRRWRGASTRWSRIRSATWWRSSRAGASAWSAAAAARTPNISSKLYRKVHGHSYEEEVDAARQTATRRLERQPEVRRRARRATCTPAPMVQNPGPTMIGERVNTQGSRKVKQLLLDDDYDSVIPIAVQQVESGAHMLDVQVALTERADEAEQMKTLVKKLAMAVEVPLIIDVTDPPVAEAALSVYPGRAHHQRQQPRKRARAHRQSHADCQEIRRGRALDDD